ncbi:MAG: hypothetical protein WAV15_02090 [Minisyncoccia bacterium]
MDPESKKMLEETFRLSEENNKILRKVRSVQKWSFLWQALKIFVIIGVALGAFYYLNPYIDGLINVYSSMSGLEEKFTGGGGSLENFLSNFKN